jgi:uncharacterized protein DUF4382
MKVLADWVRNRWFGLLATAGSAALLMAATPCAAQVTTMISASSTCTSPFSHVYLTVSNVKAHLHPDAPGAASGWQSLTPGLSKSPVQIDAMAEPSQDCSLAALGSSSTLPAGKYQQIRVILFGGASHGNAAKKGGGGTPPSTNACSSIGKLPATVFNCVQLASDGSFHALSIGSAGKNGIKIPPGAIGNGGLKVNAGKALDLDLDFNACESIVQTGNSGKFRLKPTLRADEVGLSPEIDGTVVEATVSNNSVSAGANAVAGAHVWLEQQSSDFTQTGAATIEKVDNLVQTVNADSSGHFRFCPVGSGTYEIVTDAESVPSSAGTPSNATVTTGVVVDAGGGPANLVIPVVSDSTAAATISGEVTTANPVATGDNVSLSALQPFGATPVQALVPFFTGTVPTPPTVTTSATGTANGCTLGTICPIGTNCACYSLVAPASNPVVGAANTDGSGYAVPTAAPPINFQVGGSATALGSSSPVCSPSSLFTATFAVTGGATTTAPELDFTGCD